MLQRLQYVTLCSLSPHFNVYQHTWMDVTVELVGASLFKGDCNHVAHCLADPVRMGAQQSRVQRLTREVAWSAVRGGSHNTFSFQMSVEQSVIPTSCSA